MKLVRYRFEDLVAYGVLEDDVVQPLIGDPFGPHTRGQGQIRTTDLTLLAPCAPGKILSFTQNYADRAREVGTATPPFPLLSLKPPSAVIGPLDSIVLPPQSARVDYGAELAVVIGRLGRWIAVEEVAQYVLGYTCANNVVARDLVELDGSWVRGGAFDTFCPLGPVIQTHLALADTLVQCRVNGQTRQMTSTHDLLFGVSQLIAFASSVMTLEPGDVVLTGTPAGVAPLSTGDVIEVEVEGIGVLRNTVVAEPRQPAR